MAEKKNKHDLAYLFKRYTKFYNMAELKKADEYNDLAIRLHGVDLRDKLHARQEKRDKKNGPFGLGKTKRMRYG